MSGPVAFILKGYPRLSETFIAQEIAGLERRGLALHLYSLRRPTDGALHPIHRTIRAPVTYLPEYLHEAPLRVFRAWRALHRRPAYAAARALWLKDLRRDLSRSRVRRFGQALVLAHEMPGEIGALHAHFLHTPASVARYAAVLRGLPLTISAHAKDIWTTPDWEKREKLAHCRWLVTCSAAAAEHLRPLAPTPDRVDLIYHGLDGSRFPPSVRRRPPRDGRDRKDPVIVLSVGRAVEKKGFEDLLAALARLDRDLEWRFVHIGGGPRLARLKGLAERLGLTPRVRWLGPQTQEVVLAHYRAADLFVLASRIAGDGDRDGLPNVLLEAQSQGLACLATAVSAIPELVRDGETGILVPPGSPGDLTCGLDRLIRAPLLRARLGTAGQERVARAFSAEDSLDRLAARFGLTKSADALPCASPFTLP